MRISDWSSDVCSSDLTDITEQKESEERHKQLMREVDHRAKNALAVAQAVVTLTSASNIDEYRKLVESRIAALSRAHMLLADHRWQGVELRSIINGELGARAGVTGQIRMSGETVRSEEHTSELQSLMRTSYAVFCLKKKKKK